MNARGRAVWAGEVQESRVCMLHPGPRKKVKNLAEVGGRGYGDQISRQQAPGWNQQHMEPGLEKVQTVHSPNRVVASEISPPKGNSTHSTFLSLLSPPVNGQAVFTVTCYNQTKFTNKRHTEQFLFITQETVNSWRLDIISVGKSIAGSVSEDMRFTCHGQENKCIASSLWNQFSVKQYLTESKIFLWACGV